METKNTTVLINEDPDNWWTPWTVYDEICSFYTVYPELDACADKFNTKCKYFITKEEDALKANWHNGQFEYVDVWFNAPGKHIQEFVDKAYEEWRKHNMNIIGFLSINTLSNGKFKRYWNLFLDKKISIDPLFGVRPRFLDGRLDKVDPLTPKFASRNGYMSLLFKKE